MRCEVKGNVRPQGIVPTIIPVILANVGNGFDRSVPRTLVMFPYNNPRSHHVYFPGLHDAARRPTGTPAGDSREKCGQLRPSFVVFADRSGLQKSADMPSVR